MSQQAVSAFEFVRNTELLELALHWASLLKGARPPERRELDALAFHRALPHVWMCERPATRAGGYRVRLAGEDINLLFGPGLRGQYLEAVLDRPALEAFVPALDAVLDSPAFSWCEGPLRRADPDGTVGECVMMPLLERGVPRIVLGATVHGWRQAIRHPSFRSCAPKTELLIPLAALAMPFRETQPQPDEHLT
jgi:hypothetical protein